MYSGAMESQSQIKRCLSEASAIAQVCGILHQDEVTHRTDLARRLCSHYGFFNAQGQAQIAGCLKALGELSNAGHFTLPAARSRPAAHPPRRLATAVPLPAPLPETAGAVQGLKLVLVRRSRYRPRRTRRSPFTSTVYTAISLMAPHRICSTWSESRSPGVRKAP